MTKVGAARSNLAPLKMLPSKVKEQEMGFLGTMTSGKLPKVKTSGKLPKVKEKSTVASTWAVTLAEKTTPVLAAIELDL